MKNCSSIEETINASGLHSFFMNTDGFHTSYLVKRSIYEELPPPTGQHVDLKVEQRTQTSLAYTDTSLLSAIVRRLNTSYMEPQCYDYSSQNTSILEFGHQPPDPVGDAYLIWSAGALRGRFVDQFLAQSDIAGFGDLDTPTCCFMIWLMTPNLACQRLCFTYCFTVPPLLSNKMAGWTFLS